MIYLIYAHVHDQLRRAAVQRCTQEMIPIMQTLSKRYPPMVVIAALNERLAASLFVAHTTKLMSEFEVRETIARVKTLALAKL